MSLLTSYATPERMQRFETSIIKRGRSAHQVDSEIRLHEAFVAACKLALSHHRYASMEDNLGAAVYTPHKKAPAADSKETKAVLRTQVTRAKERAKKGLKSDHIIDTHNPETVAIEKLRMSKLTKQEPKPLTAPKTAHALADLKDLVNTSNDL